MTRIELSSQKQKNNHGATVSVAAYSVVHNGWLVIRTTSKRLATVYRDRLEDGSVKVGENGKSI